MHPAVGAGFIRPSLLVSSSHRLLVSLALLVSTTAAPLAAQGGIPVGTAGPVVTIPDLDGKPYDLGQVVGKKPVLLEFWATWCPLCEALLPKIKAAAAKYAQDVAFIGVNVTVNQTKNRVHRYLTQHEPPFLTLWDDQGVAVRAYDVTGTSFIVILDATGKVAYTGYGEDQELMAPLAKVTGR